jgi:NitT/TauT family transport system substrate-binding protein
LNQHGAARRVEEETMSQLPMLDRRSLLIGGGALSAALAANPSTLLAKTAQPEFAVKVASNQGIENATIQQLMIDRGIAKSLNLDLTVVESKVINGPMDALLSGAADICMISGFVGVLPAIEQGKDLRLVGAAMMLPALAVYTTRPEIRRAKDLEGRTVGVGAMNGLLHILMLDLLRKKGVDASKVKFVNSGSNAQVLADVVAGKVDAGLSGTAGLSNPDQARVLDDGRLWRELPEYTYQPAYASVRAIKENPEGLSRCMAAYMRLYRYMTAPGSTAAYLNARRTAGGEAAVEEGKSVLDFVQKYHPYAIRPGLLPEQVAYLQRLNVDVGLQKRVLPFDQVADLSIARGARRFL